MNLNILKLFKNKNRIQKKLQNKTNKRSNTTRKTKFAEVNDSKKANR